MRYVALALVLLCFPVFYNLLKQNPSKRPLAFAALGFLLFTGGSLRIDASIIAWPMWTGLEKGMGVAPTEMLAAALLLTRRRVPGKIPFWGLIAFFVVPIWFSLVFASVPMATFFSCWQSLRIVLLFAVVAGEVDHPAIRRSLMTGLSLGLILQAGYVADQKATGMVQATGTMFHQNTLGMMVELAIMPLIAALLAGDRRKILIVGIIAGMFIIACGGSRGAMSIAGAGAVLLAIVSLARRITPIKMKVVGFMALGIALATPLAIMTLKNRFGELTVTVVDDQRINFENAARAMAADHPLGVGANLYVTTANIQGYAERAGVAWNFANRSAPVHNAYLLARAETGWIGEIALWCLLVIPFGRAIIFAFGDRRNPWGEAALGSAAALGANLFHNNFEFATLMYYVQTLLVVNIAIVSAGIRATKLTKQRRRPTDPPKPELSSAMA